MTRQLRDAILLILDECHRADGSTTIDDTYLAEQLNAPLEDIRRQLDILEAQGLTREANTAGGHSAYISPRGMVRAEELREAVEAAASSPRRRIGFS